eukprot:302352-Prymnesium_polylepis.1
MCPATARAVSASGEFRTLSSFRRSLRPSLLTSRSFSRTLSASGLLDGRCVARYTLALAPRPSWRPSSSSSSRSDVASPGESGLCEIPFRPMVNESCENEPVADIWKEPCRSIAAGIARPPSPPGFLRGMARSCGCVVSVRSCGWSRGSSSTQRPNFSL